MVTSNCDRQFMRTGFPMDRVFEAQAAMTDLDAQRAAATISII